jgi:hypothetical protein
MDSESPGFHVDNDCSFTEGAVDAVACDVLLNEVLSDEANLPPMLRILREAFAEFSRKYHDKRFDYQLPTDKDYDDPTNGILRARFFGRKKVYGYLRDIQRKCRKPDGWAHSLILSLNLQLTRAQRTTFYRLMDRLCYQQALGVLVARVFDVYRRDHDLKDLLARLGNLLRR